MNISSWLNLGCPVPPGRGSAAERKFLGPSYYSQQAVFASLQALFSVRYGFILLCYSNYVPKRFWDFRLQKMSWPWNPGERSLKVIGTDKDQSATYDFLLTLHSNHKPISYRFRDKRRFQLKIAIFFPPASVFNAHSHWRGSLGIGYRHKGLKTRRMWLSDGQKVLR